MCGLEKLSPKGQYNFKLKYWFFMSQLTSQNINQYHKN